MASKFLRRQQWWIKFRHPQTGEVCRESLRAHDEVRAELLRTRIDVELQLLEPRIQNVPLDGSVRQVSHILFFQLDAGLRDLVFVALCYGVITAGFEKRKEAVGRLEFFKSASLPLGDKLGSSYGLHHGVKLLIQSGRPLKRVAEVLRHRRQYTSFLAQPSPRQGERSEGLSDAATCP